MPELEVPFETFTDVITQNVYALQQAKGLNKGERALIFIKSPKYGNVLPKGATVCSYTDSFEFVSEEEFRKDKTGRSAYAVTIDYQGTIIIQPTSLTPTDSNMGLFANGRLNIDPDRQVSNVRFCVAYRKKWNMGIRICLKATREIRSGDEVVNEYGDGYARFLEQQILCQASTTEMDMS
jgi:hypothetical protein